MKYHTFFIFLKKQQKLKWSSAANYRIKYKLVYILFKM